MGNIVENVCSDNVVVYDKFGDYSEPEYSRRITLAFNPETLTAYIDDQEAVIGDGDSATNVIELKQNDYHFFVTLSNQELIDIFL